MINRKDDIIKFLKNNIKIDDKAEFYNYINLSDKEHKLVLSFRNNLRVKKWMFNKREISIEEHKNFVKYLRNNNNKFYWLVTFKKNYVGVGDISQVDFENKRCSWGYFLNPDYLGSGAGVLLEFYLLKVVFDIMKFHSVRCETLENNKNALRIHQMFGFHKEGILRDYIFNKEQNKYFNVVIHSIIDNEWGKKKKELSGFITKIKEKFL